MNTEPSIELIEQSTLPDADFEGYLHGPPCP